MGCQWKELPIEKDSLGQPEIHYSRIYRKFASWETSGVFKALFYTSIKMLKEADKLDVSILHGDGSNTVAKKGGDVIGYSGHKHQKGEKVVPIIDNLGNILAPMTVAAVNEGDMVLLPDSIDDLKQTCKVVELEISKNTPLNLDGGFDSKKNRKKIWNAGLKPNIKENKRNRKKVKRGRKRYFDQTIYDTGYKNERTFAWMDKFRKLVIRYEVKHQRFFAFCLLGFAMINLRLLL